MRDTAVEWEGRGRAGSFGDGGVAYEWRVGSEAVAQALGRAGSEEKHKGCCTASLVVESSAERAVSALQDQSEVHSVIQKVVDRLAEGWVACH